MWSSEPLNVVTSSGGANPIIAASRLTTFQPGVTYNGGIPNRTTIFTTLTPLGGASDDTPQIQNALDTCPANQVVFLNPGTFNINGNGLNFHTSNITLRGSGPGPGSAIPSGGSGPATAPGTYTALWKADRGSSGFGLLYMNQFALSQITASGTSTNLTADAVKETNSVTVASTAGLSVGLMVLIDINTDSDPDVFWGNRQDAPGAVFTASTSGSSLTISAFLQGASANVSGGQNVYDDSGLVGTISSGSGNSWTFTSSVGTISSRQMSSGNSTRRFFCRQDRSICQVMRISSIVGNLVSFETKFHITFPVAYFAQLTTNPTAQVENSGIENLYLYGGVGGDNNGNLPMAWCYKCWVKNVESHYSQGTGIGLTGCLWSEVRDSYMHETPDPNPGGGGYLSGMNFGTADSLFENNIMWNGNKQIVMRATGGGNVVAYNYMDDAYGSGYPQLPEAGLNASHFTTPHFELLEGNYSHQGTLEAFWGNSIYITFYRNWVSGLRAAAAPLNTYTFNDGAGNIYPYRDSWSRVAMAIQAHSYNGNFVGNVLGYQGQALISINTGGNTYTQTSFVTQNLGTTFPPTGSDYELWTIGIQQDPGSNSWIPNQDATLQRSGNWAWTSGSAGAQTWYGIGGAAGSQQPQPIPASLYLTSAPPFFSGGTWPWVNPTNGSVATLPAKAKFLTLAGTGLTIPPGNQ